MDKHLHKILEHRHALIFLGGMATAYAGKKIIESDTVKKACTEGMAKVLAVKRDAEECFQDMKDNAEDIATEASEKEKEKIYVEE